MLLLGWRSRSDDALVQVLRGDAELMQGLAGGSIVESDAARSGSEPFWAAMRGAMLLCDGAEGTGDHCQVGLLPL